MRPTIPFVRALRLRRDRVRSFSRYPFSLPAVRGLYELPLLDDGVTFFAGENGTGKSTLLEAIAVRLGFNPEGGSGELRFSTVGQSHSGLSEYVELVPAGAMAGDGFFVRTEGLFNLATEIDRQDEEMEEIARNVKALTGVVMTGYRPMNVRYGGGRSLHAQSHGEAMLALLNNRLHGGGVYLMDEPETALSPLRQLALLSVMHRLVRGGSQLVIATHSPILLAYPGARIYRFGEEGIEEVGYEETEAYQVTRDFLNHRERSLRTLFSDDSDEED
ncbi:MAG TPA: AAA family ATPase [Longimicrobium sp.]|nr:AAA family ATPase [Longimicrobium sp.]